MRKNFNFTHLFAGEEIVVMYAGHNGIPLHLVIIGDFSEKNKNTDFSNYIDVRMNVHPSQERTLLNYNRIYGYWTKMAQSAEIVG
jgi:hypothetical protein